MDFSVVIPVYNEERRVAEALRRVEAYMTLKNLDWELLVSSDGSTDSTDRIVSERAKVQPRIKLLTASPNKGKGAAARRGMLAARGKYVLMTDVDLSSPIKESDRLVEAIIAGCDAAIGSRAVRKAGTDVQQSFKRYLSGRLFNFFVKLFVTTEFRDTQCGFKCFTRDAAQKLFSEQKLEGFAFDVEILYLAKKKGLRVAEVPVMWRQGTDSKVNVFKDSFIMVGDLMKIKKLHA
jgi:dolichyl-phosphate beta-glucosyltransferase